MMLQLSVFGYGEDQGGRNVAAMFVRVNQLHRVIRYDLRGELFTLELPD